MREWMQLAQGINHQGTAEISGHDIVKSSVPQATPSIAQLTQLKQCVFTHVIVIKTPRVDIIFTLLYQSRQ